MEISLPCNQASDFLEAGLENVIVVLSTNGVVKLSSFGSFNVSQKAKHIGQNPKTEKEAVIAPRRVLAFKPSQYLREKVQRHKS